MKKKGGFTIVELLAVLMILSLIIVLLAPTIGNSQKNAKQKTYETRVSNFESAAAMYAEDNYQTFASTDNFSNTVTIPVTVEELFNKGYLVNDESYLVDPRDTSKSLKDERIFITINTETKKIDTYFEGNASDTTGQILIYRGDVNYDGAVTYEDAVMILKVSARNISFTNAQNKAADINGDGYIDATDALWAMQMASGSRSKEIMNLDSTLAGANSYKLTTIHDMYKKVGSYITVYKGDLNHDGTISSNNEDNSLANDGRSILKVSAGNVTLTTAQSKVADVNGYSHIDATDALWAMQMASGSRTKRTIKIRANLEGASDFIIPQFEIMYK